jgi:hypothetical protein
VTKGDCHGFSVFELAGRLEGIVTGFGGRAGADQAVNDTG